MAKTRLSGTKRLALRGFARDVVTCPDHEDRIAVAYTKAEPLVRAAVEAVYPPADMEVCKRHEAAQIDDCIKLDLTAGGLQVFNFDSGTGPLVVQMTYHGKVYATDKQTSGAVTRWAKARDEHKDALHKKLVDYEALINASRTFEDVVEIWPEAEAMRDKICKGNTALTVVTPDLVQRIKVDCAARLAA